MELKKIKSRKGIGHVEFIISFVIFVSFVLIIFVIFNPFKKPANTSLVDSVYFNLEENLTSVLSSVSINVNTGNIPPGTNCLEIDYLPEMNCGGIEGRNLIVKNLSGDIIGSSLNDAQNPTLIRFSYSRGNGFYTFYCSDELKLISNSFTVCTDIDVDDDYQLGIIRERKVWSEKRLNSFEQQYNSNYGEIKKKVISEGNDFGFLVTDLDNVVDINATSQRPSRGNIFAKTFPIDTINENAEIQKHTIIVLMW